MNTINLKKGGKFINFGCYDGIEDDPIIDYITKYKLSGFFVDANSDALTKCRNNFNSKNFNFVNIGIHTVSKPQIFYKPINLKSLPKWYLQTGTFDYNQVVKVCNILNIPTESYRSELIECETIEEFICKRNLFNLEIINIDLEGLDSLIIRQFPFHLVKPKVIIIEIVSEKGIDNSTYDFLCSNNYTSKRNRVSHWSIEFILND